MHQVGPETGDGLPEMLQEQGIVVGSLEGALPGGEGATQALDCDAVVHLLRHGQPGSLVALPHVADADHLDLVSLV